MKPTLIVLGFAKYLRNYLRYINFKWSHTGSELRFFLVCLLMCANGGPRLAFNSFAYLKKNGVGMGVVFTSEKNNQLLYNF